MKTCLTHLTALLLLVCCSLFFGCTAPPMERIVIVGSTTMAPLLERLALKQQKGDEQRGRRQTGGGRYNGPVHTGFRGTENAQQHGQAFSGSVNDT